MPLFGRKKSEKSSKEVRPKSHFYDQQPDPEELVNTRTSRKEKRISKSKFYDDVPSSDGTPVHHTDGSTVRKNVAPGSPNARLSVEPQGDLGRPQSSDKWSKRTSILSRSFIDCLLDKDVIGYFMQFLTSKEYGHLLKFWMTAQNFYDASTVRIRGQSLNSSSQSGQTAISSTSNPKHAQSATQTKPPAVTAKVLESSVDDLLESIKADAVNIYSTYISIDCHTDIGISDELRNLAIYAITGMLLRFQSLWSILSLFALAFIIAYAAKICSEGGTVDPLCFKECQEYIERVLEKEYYKEFLESSYYRKYQIDCLTSGNLELTDILYNDNIMFYFMEFVEQEGASSLLQFWMAVDNFQSQLSVDNSTYTGKDAQSDAMVLYDKYFSLQASEPLGFSDKVRTHVELNICREAGPLPDCFVIPKAIVLETIETTLFQAFLQSQVYYRFLSELIGSAKPTSQLGTPKLKSKKVHRTGSASSYDTHSLGGQSNLSVPNGSMSASSSTSDIRSAKLGSEADDQPLWRRPQARRHMSLGHFNEFGQYVSDVGLENIPNLDKKKGNRFSRKKREKEKAEEYMAWQITKMIISGINKEVSSSGEKASLTEQQPSHVQSTKL